jgi:transposase
MLKLPGDTRIFMAVAPVDMRRSFDGLCATVMEVLQSNPLEGHLFLLRGKRADDETLASSCTKIGPRSASVGLR